MIELEKAADQYVLRDDDLEFSFRFVGDRWQHEVRVRCENAWNPLLTSLEGNPADSGLPSPAFQDLRFEQPAEGVYEFQLMGQSGKGVYSAAVRFDAAQRMLDFDLCARAPDAYPGLCTVSTYCTPVMDPVPGVRLDGGSAIIGTPGYGSLKIVPVPIPGSPASECRLTGETGWRRLTVGCFGVEAANFSGKTRSIRWRQQIRRG